MSALFVKPTAADPCPVAMRGIVPSLNTPFDASGEADEKAYACLVDHSICAGAVGLLALAVAGEQGTLTLDEKARLARVAVETAGGRVPVIVSVTNPDEGARLALARLAKAAGADGVCCQAPAGLTGEALEAALARVALAGPDLLMLQDLDWTGGGLALQEIVALFERLPAFRCLKIETAPAGPKYSAVLAATDRRLHVSGGWAVQQMPDALARGVHAFMPTAMDETYVAIYRLWTSGRADDARALFEQLLPVLAFANQHIDVSIRFLKLLRFRDGLFATAHCRPPVREFDAVQASEAERMIARVKTLTGRLGASTP
jgi:dihydrodipicolinate synthase/N-acetylneuraminate lyase